jgi:xylulose-5-phosphate/fructose-6-phosphate phosphoketolase
VVHCTKGIGIWKWASNDEGSEPDVVVASAGDILTQEALAAVAILRENLPDLKIRFSRESMCAELCQDKTRS